MHIVNSFQKHHVSQQTIIYGCTSVQHEAAKSPEYSVVLNECNFSNNLLKVLNGHANAIGVPQEFILWPLLTATASFMGTNAFVKINEEWWEPSIIWFVIAARKGEKKTAALKRIRKPIEAIQNRLKTEWQKDTNEQKPSSPPQLIVDHFSFEELHSIMCRNRSQVLGCFDEMSSFYGQLDLYKHSSTVDRKTLLTLNGGGSWARNFKSYTGIMEKTAFNVTGFIQPAFVYEMLNLKPDSDGLNDRQLFDFPPERELLLDDLVVPMPSDTPDLQQIFTIIADNHQQQIQYTLQGEAYSAYRDIHDKLVRQKLHSKHENAQGILSKARGYCARIAMVIHCLEQALQLFDSTHTTPWNSNISLEAVQAATTVIMHFIQQKFIMLGIDVESSTTDVLTTRMVRLLTTPSKNGNGILTPSLLSQKHISERVGGSYPTSKAIEMLEEAETLGYGSFEDVTPPNKRTIKQFRKRRLEDLTNKCKDLLKRSKISDKDYSCAFNNDHSIIDE